MDIEKYKKYIKNDVELLSVEKRKNRTVITIKCKKCGVISNQRLDYYLEGWGCRGCKKILSQEQFIKKGEKLHYDNFDYSMVNYINAHSKVIIGCKKCGNIFNQRISAHLEGEGCPRCNIIRQLSTNEDFIKKSIKIYGDRFDYSLVDYKTNKIKVKIKCKKHNYIFEQSPNSHLRGQGCPICNESKGEKKVGDFLILNKINYSRNYRFIDCRYKNPLPFDFYLPDYNICIEFDGIQHFEDRMYDNEGENLTIRKIRDNIKDEYCNKNNIMLIRIKHTESISKKLNFLIL